MVRKDLGLRICELVKNLRLKGQYRKVGNVSSQTMGFKDPKLSDSGGEVPHW